MPTRSGVKLLRILSSSIVRYSRNLTPRISFSWKGRTIMDLGIGLRPIPTYIRSRKASLRNMPIDLSLQDILDLEEQFSATLGRPTGVLNTAAQRAHGSHVVKSQVSKKSGVKSARRNTRGNRRLRLDRENELK